MGLLDGNSVLVTGGGLGIGRALCEVAAREGARVTIADFNADAGEEALASLAGAGAEAQFIKADLSREDDVRAVITAAVDEYGSLDCAFNNAALSHGRGPLHEIAREDFERTLEYCLTNTFLCMKYELASMVPGRSGAIVNISSNAAERGDPNNAPYAAAKAAVNTLTLSSAAEYAARGIRINAVSPGVTDTPGLRAYTDSHPEVEQWLTTSAPMKRLGEPREIAELAVFLASERASFITGQIVSVDGGLSVRAG